MADSHKPGKLTLLLICSNFLCFSYTIVLASETHTPSISTPVSNPVIQTNDKNEVENPNFDFIKSQQLQLEKLEALVENLNQIVARLESQFEEGRVKVKTTSDEIRDLGKIREDDDSKLGVREKGAEAVVVSKYNTVWSERFQFVSAVKLRSNPTCINVFPYRDFEGLSKYFAVGDDKGKVRVFSRSGDVALVFDAFLDGEETASVTSMVSYLSVFKNESMVVSGHKNGAVVMHRVWEVMTGDELSALNVERVRRFEMPESKGLKGINLLEVHYVGRKRYILAMDDGGSIIVFKEDGTVHGVVTPNRRPVAFMKQRLLFLTENGAGSLDLRTMKLKESECEGWNGSFAMSYAFDAMDRSKAYGITSEGDLVQTFLLGDTMNFMCRVRSKRKVDMDEPLNLQAIKGYLLISNKERVSVYNISSQQYVRAGGLRLMFSVGLDDIIGSFLNRQRVDNNDNGVAIPLIASDHEKHVIVSFGNGYVGMYRSNLPTFKNEFNSILWSSPVLFFIIFLFGAWHFFANKKEALTSWGPDVPFTLSPPVSSGAQLGSAGSDRSYPEPARSSEIMEMRGGGGLRGTSRYGSPPRYQGGGANSYSSDTDSRSTPVDPRFRPGSDLKFRGSNVEGGGVPKRRDGLFVGGQVTDDGN